MRSLYDPRGIHALSDERVARIAARQHGVFSRAQAMGCGATHATIKWRLRVRRWELLHARVYKLAVSPKTWRQQAMAACLYLGSGVALSHRAASALGNLPGFRDAYIEVTVPRNRNRTRLTRIKVHRTGDPLPADDIATIDGIPVTKPARTLLDLSATEPEEVVEGCLDDLLRRRLVSLPFLDRWLTDPIRSRHRGARVLRRLVDARATVGVTESPLETAVLRLLRSDGLPIPMLQYRVEDGSFRARLDFAYPNERVAIEADGFRYHDDRRGFDDERARGNRLAAMGWQVLRVTSNHIEEDRGAVVEWVRRALDR